jgi:DNA-binding IclR family transcriptional regulator
MSTVAVQSVLRALSLVDAVASWAGSPTATQLAADAGLPLPTAHHLLKTLVLAGYLARDGRTYQLAPKIAELHAAFEQQIEPGPELVRALHRLAASVGETAYVSRWVRGNVTIVAVAEGVQAVQVGGVYVGLRGHGYARASGKVLLAFGPPNRLEQYLLSSEPERLTPNTIVEPDRLRAELAAVRARGYAVDREEFAPGVCCISAPVLGDGGVLATAALTVSLPASRFDSAFDHIVHELRAEVRVLGPGPGEKRQGSSHGAHPRASQHPGGSVVRSVSRSGIAADGE